MLICQLTAETYLGESLNKVPSYGPFLQFYPEKVFLSI